MRCRLAASRLLRTKDYCPSSAKRPEIEDLLRETLVGIAKDDLGWDVSATASAQPDRPIVEIFKSEISGFSKYKLVRAFVRWLAANDAS